MINKMLVYYPYTFANRSNLLALARIYLMYLAFIDSLYPSSINHTNVYTFSSYDPKVSNHMNLTIWYYHLHTLLIIQILFNLICR